MSIRNTSSVDGVRLALLTSRLQSVARAMMNTLARTGRSGILNTARDFSCCIVTARGELLAMAESLPIHVMSGPDLMAQAMLEFHPEVAKGDAFLHNSPYHGNSHAADHTLLVPVVDGGEHRYTLMVKAHQADCGNAAPTTYSADATDVYAEGALIFPCVQIQRDYEDVADIVRMCRMRIRVPDQWWGDYLAMLGAARIGERMMFELGEEIGWDVLDEYRREWFDYSERCMIEAISRLPAESVTYETCHDPFPGIPDGVTIKVVVDVDPIEKRIRVDLRHNDDCQPSGLNLTESTARTAAMIGVFNSLGPGVPPNAGSFRRLEVLLRDNCIVGRPTHPYSCSVSTTNLADRLTNAVQGAFASIGDGYGMAETGAAMPPAWGVISGRDPRHGHRAYINQIFLPSVTGGAGGPVTDGWLTIGHVGNAGMMLRDSVEIDEMHHPIRIERQHILPDTEGAGRRRGAPAALVEYGPTHAAMDVMYGSDGAVHAAKGVRGGGAGATSAQFLRRADGELVELPPVARVTLQVGETIVSHSTGGGGYGHPRDREPDLVLHDVMDGLVTSGRARTVYGLDTALPTKNP
ncbi:hydantoinase B/oxoprolinase family protein [Prauserella muralis]|uniref:Hydantoinase n=1 Tax=Prauserella muralis TaxID=588067 RepID=A0A2V4AJE3_9PSEU|nr:hydantoinase B/oxoprolinase family protein [Prauserella muralis]PXY18963.1 hydantoinase [Prauserella muralis]TWE28848.1 N-methylhydantoinase B/oxoprolinase/acetone carboxylase alpha subunit [Prauserella muralis]